MRKEPRRTRSASRGAAAQWPARGAQPVRSGRAAAALARRAQAADALARRCDARGRVARAAGARLPAIGHSRARPKCARPGDLSGSRDRSDLRDGQTRGLAPISRAAGRSVSVGSEGGPEPAFRSAIRRKSTDLTHSDASPLLYHPSASNGSRWNEPPRWRRLRQCRFPRRPLALAKLPSRGQRPAPDRSCMALTPTSGAREGFLDGRQFRPTVNRGLARCVAKALCKHAACTECCRNLG